MTRHTCKAIVALTAFTMLFLATTAQAQFTVFTNRASFEASVTGLQTETFETVPLQSVPISGGVITTSLFSIVVDQNHGGIGIVGSGAVNGSREFAGDVHGPSAGNPFFNTLNFFAPVTAFGADFALIDEGGILNLNILGSSFQLPSGTTFFGVASAVPFTQVDLRTTGAIAEIYGMDNVSLAQAGSPGIIPEPGTCALLAAGVLPLVGVVARRRKA